MTPRWSTKTAPVRSCYQATRLEAASVLDVRPDLLEADGTWDPDQSVTHERGDSGFVIPRACGLEPDRTWTYAPHVAGVDHGVDCGFVTSDVEVSAEKLNGHANGANGLTPFYEYIDALPCSYCVGLGERVRQCAQQPCSCTCHVRPKTNGPRLPK